MINSVPIHTLTVGSVTATVHRVDGRHEADYYVTVAGGNNGQPLFLPEQLGAFQEAVNQAEMFIGYQEQIARMNWCPGCGDG